MRDSMTGAGWMAAVIASLCLAACQPAGEQTAPPAIEANVEGAARPWTSLAPLDAPEDFHFVVVTDRTGSHRPGVFSGAMPKVNLLAPAFVVSVGDLIEGYTEDQARLDQEWDEIEGFVDQLDAPFFYTAGNHDMNNAVMAETWQRRFGPSFYHFAYKDVLFLVLNSELFGMVGAPDVPVPGPWTQPQQMDFVRQVLADNPDPRWTVVLLHQPLWESEPVDEDWLEVERLLGERDYTVFAGHFHRYSLNVRNDRKFITLATTGGGSALRGDLFGEFDHVAWVTMSADGPTIANVKLDGIVDDDVSNPQILARTRELAVSVTSTPEVSNDLEFRSVTQRVRINNPGDADLYAAPRLALPGSFDVDGLGPVTVPPGETAELELLLSVDEPTPYRVLTPAAVSWTLTTQIGDRPAQLDSITPLLPLSRHPIARGTAVIDGDLAEWGELAYAATRQGDVASADTAPADISYRFDLREDDDALYLAVDVTDDSLVSRPDRIAREQDTIVVAIDTRGEPERNRSMPVGEAVVGGDMAKMAMTMLTVDETADDSLLDFMAETAAATTAVTQRRDGGYRAEIAFPHELLDAKAGGRSWDTARVVISVYDFDEGESGNVVLHWQPYRYGDAPLPGSHTFVRAR